MGQNFFSYLVIFFLGIGTGFFLFSSQTPSQNTKISISPTAQVLSQTSETAKVTRVVDGDTIEIEGGKKIRYIGIDTPETVDPRKEVQCFGKEASNKNKELVLGKTVKMEKDVSETDRYGRLLRYIYVDDPTSTISAQVFVNEYLVREGYAYADTYPPDVKYSDHFKQIQTEAQQNAKGLWSSCPQ